MNPGRLDCTSGVASAALVAPPQRLSCLSSRLTCASAGACAVTSPTTASPLAEAAAWTPAVGWTACGWAWGTAADYDAAPPPMAPEPAALSPLADPHAATRAATAAAARSRTMARLINRDSFIPNTPILAGPTGPCTNPAAALPGVRGRRLRVRHRPGKAAALARCAGAFLGP